MNLRQAVFDALSKEPTLTNKQLYNLFPKGNKTSIRVYIADFKKQNNVVITPKKIPKSTHKPSPPLETTTFIDDPNELLMSVAVRELNKPDPDPRWASILINCKKENITTKGDDIESFRKLPNQVLATLLNKSRQKTS